MAFGQKTTWYLSSASLRQMFDKNGKKNVCFLLTLEVKTYENQLNKIIG